LVLLIFNPLSLLIRRTMDCAPMDLTLIIASPDSRPPATPPSPAPPPSEDIEMKDVSYASSRPSRNIVYPKKRPSPSGGVSKSRGRSSPCLPSTSTRRHSVAAKAEQLARKQRQAQIERLHKQGIYIEEEYREEICAYMRDMEVSLCIRCGVTGVF
jgi:hypothetical protein